MGQVEAIAFAVLSGITVSGIAGSLMELAAARPLSFSEPFVSSRRIGRSLATTALAGPLMLANDALSAWREGAISRAMLLSCGCTAVAWSFAIGIVVLHLAARVSALLS